MTLEIHINDCAHDDGKVMELNDLSVGIRGVGRKKQTHILQLLLRVG